MAILARLTSPVLRQATAQAEHDLAGCAPGIASMICRGPLNAVETTVTMLPDGTAFAVTGNTPATWLKVTLS